MKKCRRGDHKLPTTKPFQCASCTTSIISLAQFSPALPRDTLVLSYFFRYKTPVRLWKFKKITFDVLAGSMNNNINKLRECRGFIHAMKDWTLYMNSQLR
jgi:hypothetical protein